MRLTDFFSKYCFGEGIGGRPGGGCQQQPEKRHCPFNSVWRHYLFNGVCHLFISRRIPPYPAGYSRGVICRGGLYPTAMLIDLILPGASYQIGVFLPLMITNSLIVWRSGIRFHKESKPKMIGDLVCHILGFLASDFAGGRCSWIWGSGTLWDIKCRCCESGGWDSSAVCRVYSTGIFGGAAAQI